MNVLLVVPWDEERGGVVTVVENLATALKSRGHEVRFLHPGRPILLRRRTTKAGFPGVMLRLGFPFAEPRRIISAIAFPFLFPIVLLQLLWFLRSNRIHIVNVHFPSDRFFYFAICKHLLGIRLVTSVHGSEMFDRGRPRDDYSRVFEFIMRSSDLIVLPSNSYLKKFVNVFPQLTKRALFIHNGVDPARFSGGLMSADVREHQRYILCIAGLVEWKGIDVLLRAAASVLKSEPSVKVMLVGDGPLRKSLGELASSLDIHHQTQFVGTKGFEEVVRLLSGCELLVLPSRAESFGLVIVEAMACKKPVIASAVGGVCEIIEDGINGILVEPDNAVALGDAIERVITDPLLKRSLAHNGYLTMLRRFTLGHTADRYETAFASLVPLQNRSQHSPSAMSPTGSA